MATSNLITYVSGEIDFQYGNGNPTHNAKIYSQYIDIDTGIKYTALDASGTWDYGIWTPAGAQIGDVSVSGVSVFLALNNNGKYYSFPGNADGIIAINLDLTGADGSAYDGSDLALLVEARLSVNGGVGDTVGLIVDYGFSAGGTNSETTFTNIAQQNFDVSSETANVDFVTQLGTMTGVTSATNLNIGITRNASGAGSDSFSGSWELMNMKLIKV